MGWIFQLCSWVWYEEFGLRQFILVMDIFPIIGSQTASESSFSIIFFVHLSFYFYFLY